MKLNLKTLKRLYGDQEAMSRLVDNGDRDDIKSLFSAARESNNDKAYGYCKESAILIVFGKRSLYLQSNDNDGYHYITNDDMLEIGEDSSMFIFNK